MLYDYFTKSAVNAAELATLGAPVAAAVGALSSDLTGGDWKDNLANAAGAGIGTGAGVLGGGYGIISPADASVSSEQLRPQYARDIVDARSEFKKLLAESKTNPNITEDVINEASSRIKRLREDAPGKVFANKKMRELARVVSKHPWLGIGLFAGLGGGLGYATSNALTGHKERPIQDVLIDYLKGNG